MSNHYYYRYYHNFIGYEYTTFVKCGPLVCPVHHSGCRSEQSVRLHRTGADIDTAYELIQKADQTEPVKLFCCLSTVNTPEQRGELYSRAGYIFIANSKLREAAEVFISAALCYGMINNSVETYRMYRSAAGCFDRNGDLEEAIECYTIAMNISLRKKNSLSVANLKLDLALLYERNSNYPAAIEMHADAAELFLETGSTAKAVANLMAAIGLSCETKDTPRTLGLLQRLVEIIKDSVHEKFILEECLFEICLCFLSLLSDFDQVEQKLEKLVVQFPSFQKSRGFELVCKLKDSLVSQSNEMFEEVVSEAKSYFKLDSSDRKWVLLLLAQISPKINQKEEIASQ